MAREAELDKVKSEIEKAGRTNIGKSIEKSIDPSGELSRAFDPNPASTKASAARRTQDDRPAEGEAKPAPAAGAPVAPATPAPAGNGGGVAEARKQAAAEAPPATRAKRKRRAPAGNGAAVAEDATEPARTTAPSEPG
jgi:hypothetical protein